MTIKNTTPGILTKAGLVLLLATAMVSVDGCGKKQQAEPPEEAAVQAGTEEVTQAETSEDIADADAPKTVVKSGDRIQVQYKGTLNDGSVFDESSPERPLVFVAGAGQMIPGFDKAVLGMRLNEEKTVTIPAAEAYGPKDESLVRNYARSGFPANLELAVGKKLTFRDSMGRPREVEVVEISDDSVLVDLNHFLAGQDLTFDIKVIRIE